MQVLERREKEGERNQDGVNFIIMVSLYMDVHHRTEADAIRISVHSKRYIMILYNMVYDMMYNTRNDTV